MNSNDQFETIVNTHYEALFRFAMSLTRMESDAQDLTQQTFYVWATKGHQLREISKAKTWLFTTLHRLFLETRRRLNRFVREDEAENVEPLPTLTAEPVQPGDSSDVLRALAKVDEIYQAAVALFYLEDCSYKEIATILEVPVGTVKSRIARGIIQLRQIMKLDEFRDSISPPRNQSSATSAEAPNTSQEKVFSEFRRRAQLMVEPVGCGYEGWDLSAICIGEQLVAARILVGTNN
jgi:RNA polymerase sigma-70 factor (ECF subfamily)